LESRVMMSWLPLLALGVSACPTGLLRSVTGKCTFISKDLWSINTHEKSLRFEFHTAAIAHLLDYSSNQLFVKPNVAALNATGKGMAWMLPFDATSSEMAMMIISKERAELQLSSSPSSLSLTMLSKSCTLRTFVARPHADLLGNEYHFDFPGGAKLEAALAAFYWDTFVPLVVERTLASEYPYRDGFVLSTVPGHKGSYDGTYPDVDHEFHIKGRSILGNALEANITRRMLNLQLRLAREDPTGLARIPCAVHADGPESEWYVRRSSVNNFANAEMFQATANIGIAENVWLHVAMTKDWNWLAENIEQIEAILGWVEQHIDGNGRLWSDVYYEDQNIKDGRVAQAQAFAARAFRMAAQLESKLGRSAMAKKYSVLHSRLVSALQAPLPLGFWDSQRQRFVDWVDRLGRTHDHIHLLSNVLPVTFGVSSAAQARAVAQLVDKHLSEFQRLPSFVAAQIANYSESEIGVPYDLAAMGRVWLWDSAYWTKRHNGSMVKWQLMRVIDEANQTNMTMAERYDMDYIYYVDGKDYHGAEGYYEYPAAFSWVLHHDLLGIHPSLESDLTFAPILPDFGSVTLTQPGIALHWRHDEQGISLTNLAANPRNVTIDLQGLPGAFGGDFNHSKVVELGAHARIWIPRIAIAHSE